MKDDLDKKVIELIEHAEFDELDSIIELTKEEKDVNLALNLMEYVASNIADICYLSYIIDATTFAKNNNLNQEVTRLFNETKKGYEKIFPSGNSDGDQYMSQIAKLAGEELQSNRYKIRSVMHYDVDEAIDLAIGLNDYEIALGMKMDEIKNFDSSCLCQDPFSIEINLYHDAAKIALLGGEKDIAKELFSKTINNYQELKKENLVYQNSKIEMEQFCKTMNHK